MKTACFNLVEEPWLPVTLADDFPGKTIREFQPRVSLKEAFEYGDKIVDLRCYPHERIALMRLLICIAQRALNGPQNENEWQECKNEMSEIAIRYLDNNVDCFNLFGNGPRFLQAHGSGKPGQMSVFRLVLIDKESPTLFNAHVQPGSQMDADDLAVSLVTFQSFSAGGKTGGSEPSPTGQQTKSEKIKNEPQSGEAALCRDSSALHAFILGKDLCDSIYRNLVCVSQIAAPMTWNAFSKPVWEYREVATKNLPEELIKADYMGRLVPLARAVWLENDRKHAEIANGLHYGVFADSKDTKTKRIKLGTGIRELTASITPGRQIQDKERLVSASAGDGVPKSAWRELHSIAVLGHAEKRGGPVALEHLRTDKSRESRFWCGALVGDQARVGDTIESIFRLPIDILQEAEITPAGDPLEYPGPNMIYQKGVKLADDWSKRLKNAVRKYHEDLNANKADTYAAMRYWTALEQVAESVLLHDVAVHSAQYWSNQASWMQDSPWGHEVINAAYEAYKFACPHITPRQMRAYAAGLTVLGKYGFG